jgi:hypothetical protein
MSLELGLGEYMSSAQPFIMIQTVEPELCEQEVRQFMTANLLRYKKLRNGAAKESELPPAAPVVWDALSGKQPYQFVNELKDTALGAGKPQFQVFIMRNLHRFLDNPMVIQAVQNVFPLLQQRSAMLIGTCVRATLPPELERMAVVHTHRLPKVDTLQGNAGVVADNLNRQMGAGTVSREQVEAVAQAGVGMTLTEFTSACKLSAVLKSTFDPQVVMARKQQLLRKSEILELYQPGEEDSFEYIGGLERLKKYVKRAYGPKARGVLISGVSGTGKTAVAKAMAREMGVPFVILNLSRVFNSLVGKSEERMDMALRTIDEFGNCLIFVDGLAST